MSQNIPPSYPVCQNSSKQWFWSYSYFTCVLGFKCVFRQNNATCWMKFINLNSIWIKKSLIWHLKTLFEAWKLLRWFSHIIKCSHYTQWTSISVWKPALILTITLFLSCEVATVMDDCCWTHLPHIITVKRTIHLRVITSSTLSLHVRTCAATFPFVVAREPLSLAAVRRNFGGW